MEKGSPGTGIEVQRDFLQPGTSRLRDDRSFRNRWGRRLALIPTLPFKVLAPPLVVQPAGSGAWDALQRHSQLLFRTEAEFRGARPESLAKARINEAQGGTPQELENKADYDAALAQRYDTGAALARFINRYQEKFVPQFCETGRYERPKAENAGADVKRSATVESQSTPQCKHPIALTLVGHSMGTLIIDQLLRFRADLEVANIVFMGAATSVADYTDSIHPYLERHQGEDGHAKTQMYHLVLHPLAETTEWGFLDLSPRGSLLIWIDNYFTDPITPRDRRVGRFSNLVPELRFANSVARQIHLKVFEVGTKDRCWNPQKHGDFGEFPFWDERFWSPATALNDRQGAKPPQRRDGKGCPKG